MQQDIIGIVILLLALVSYALNKIPMVLTAILSMLAMYLLGILDFAEAFSVFSNNVTMMVLGMGLIGVALSQNGIMDIVANKLNSMFSGDSKLGEKQFLLIAGGIIALGSTILNPTLMVMLFLEIVDGMAARPDSPLALEVLLHAHGHRLYRRLLLHQHLLHHRHPGLRPSGGEQRRASVRLL